ncbi:MAG TPA: alginate export family protein [Pedomonas sp.]|uniref:alginate export family protein n=1 Tax=Pedomonas sp. TaxID=2976421 RepID=UPI002F3EA244
MHKLLMGVALAATPFLTHAQATAAETADAVSVSYPAEAMGYGPRMGPNYYFSRWAEDWSQHRDPAMRDGLLDDLKFIPLDAAGESYITLNGQQRIRLNHVSNPGLRASSRTDAFLSRTQLGADVHLGSNFRAYVEVGSGQTWGSRKGPQPGAQQNDVDLIQAFGEIHGQAGVADVGVRFGRQDFSDGSQVLFATDQSPNIHLSQNGVVAYANWSNFRVSAYGFRPTVRDYGTFDDDWNDDEAIYGITTSFDMAALAGVPHKLFVDPFIFHMDNDAKRWGTMLGEDSRDTYGVRVWGSAGPVSFDWLAARQTGSFENRDVKAAGLFTTTSVRLADNRYQPTIGVRADVTTGGGAYGTGTVKNFDYGYGNSPYFADNNFISPTNLVDFAPTFAITPIKGLKLSGEYVFVWRQSESDAVYDGLKRPYAGTELVGGSKVAEIARLAFTYGINEHVSIGGLTDYVKADTVLERAGFGNSFYQALWMTFVF